MRYSALALEPVLIGLIAAPSRAGALVGATCIVLFAAWEAVRRRRPDRRFLPDVIAAAAAAGAAAPIAVAEGWNVRFAMALWAVAAARTLPAMVTVRTRELRFHGKAASSTPPLIAHASAMALIFWLQTQGLVPRGVLTVLSLLAARAGYLLRASAPPVTAQRLGIEELIAGLLAASLLGVLARR